MLIGRISIVAESQEDLVLELEALAKLVRSSCHLDDDGRHIEHAPYHAKHLMAEFSVLPKYQDGDIEKLHGCWPEIKDEPDGK